MSKKIFNIENLTFNNCCPECPEQELACRAAITGVSVNEDTDWLITTAGSQGSEVRVGVYSETLGTYSYSDWEANLVNTFTILSATMADYMANEDLQFVVEVRNLQGELCDQVFVPFFFYLGELKYLETQSIPLGGLTGLACAGTMTHELVYANGALVHPEDLSINEDLDGYLEIADFPFEDETGNVLITYYCDGVFVGLLAISMTLRMFDVRVDAVSAICDAGVLTVLYEITNIGSDTIPAGLSFDYEFTLTPPLPISGVEPASGTKVIASNILAGGTMQMSLAYVNADCLTGAVSTFEITAIPATYANFNPAYLQGTVTFTPSVLGLRMLFDDIANAPVVDPTNVGQWNTFFDLPTNGAVFTSVVVEGNQATLVGGGAMTIKNSLLSGQSYLVEIEDQSSIVIEIEDYAFQSAFAITLVGLQDLVTAGEEGFNGCSLVTTFDFPLLTTLGENFFTNCTSATLINLPLCVNLANNPASITAFQFITGQVITLNIAAVNATNNAGGVHASVAYLIANNTATVNYI